MTTPRIGDTVHYTPRRGNPTRCAAALIINIPEGPTTPGWTLRITDWSGNGYTTHAVLPDPGMGWDSFTPGTPFTPGTWHHKH